MSLAPRFSEFFYQPITLACGDVHLIGTFGNVGVFETDEGLVVFDIATEGNGPTVFRYVREITDKHIKYIIYSHGHFDHAFGFAPFVKEIEEKGWEMPQVIAHENCVKRFEKYRMLHEYHNWINSQQFASELPKASGDVVSAKETLDPTILVRGDEKYSFKLGRYTFELYPEWGETDDVLWMYVPDKKVIFAGDMLIGGFPNVGNPYKVQRYPKHWANGLERMAKKSAEYLLPGHGPLVEGQENVRECLTITAEALHFVHDEVVKRLNQGKWFEEIYHEMLEIYPEKFKHSKWLQPVYGCYQFAIHASYRLYHGWYDSGNPTDLFPSKSADIAKELLKVVGSKSEEKYFEHANKLFEEGKLQLALHILDVIIKGTDPNNSDLLLKAYKLKREILEKKASEETSLIGRNILNNGAIQVEARINDLEKKIK